MKCRFVLFWMILSYISVVRTMADIEVEHRKQQVHQSTPNPSFTWTSPFSLRVVFPNGQEDDIGLQPVEMAGKHVRCLFRGEFYKDPVSSAVVSGCIEDDTVIITIITKEMWGRTAFQVSQGLVEETENPYASNIMPKFDDNEMNEDESDKNRDKRSIFEDYEDYDYTEIVYDSAHDDNFTVPPLLTTPVKLAFDRSFKDKLGNENDARAYVRSVAEHGSLYLQNFSPKTKIFLNFVDEIEFIDQTFEPKGVDLRKAFAFKQNESIPLIIFCATDDSNDYMGVSPGPPGKACDEEKGVSILKHRSKKNLAAMTFAHELGHIHGMRHDHRENASCHGTGLMSEVRSDLMPDKRPPVFSSCSVSRFAKWLINYGACMKEGIVNKEVKLKYLDQRCTSLTASPGDLLPSGCLKPEELENGAWMCSVDGAVCYPNCVPGFTLVQPNQNAFISCVQKNWIKKPNNYSCKIDLQYKPIVFYKVSSSGEAALLQKRWLGNYFPTGEFINNFPIFKSGKGMNLYVDNDAYWIFGEKLGSPVGFIYHPDKNPISISPPHTGWKVGDSKKKTWHEDNTFTVFEEVLEKYLHVVSYRVSSSGEANNFQKKYMGDYFTTGNFVNDFPIFEKVDGCYLYVDNDGYWIIGATVGSTSGYIYHPDKNPVSISPPRTGWKFGKSKEKTWHLDNSLTVVPFPRD